MLFDNLYRHPKIEKNNLLAKDIVRELFDYFARNPEKIGETKFATTTDVEEEPILRVADYIAGMTDRFAVTTFNDLFYPAT